MHKLHPNKIFFVWHFMTNEITYKKLDLTFEDFRGLGGGRLLSLGGCQLTKEKARRKRVARFQKAISLRITDLLSNCFLRIGDPATAGLGDGCSP